MELWIRSQDKERLVKVYNVYIKEYLIRANFQEHYGGCQYIDLGEYKTKARALEVLDEIQSYLVNINDKHNNIFYYVYEMPEREDNN